MNQLLTYLLKLEIPIKLNMEETQQFDKWLAMNIISSSWAWEQH